MERNITEKAISGMQHHLEACGKYLAELAKGYRSSEKCNTLLDAAMQQVELCCIDMRLLCEKARPRLPDFRFGAGKYNHKTIYGEVNLLDNGWLDVRLNALLPHCKIVGGTQYVSDTITRLLNSFQEGGGELPHYEKAYVAIVEHCPENCSGAFDHDNKGFKGVINALKGRLFEDDNQFELALGLFTVVDEDPHCRIYVTPYDEAGDFHYQMSSFML